MSGQSLPQLLLTMARAVMPCDAAFCYAGWSNEYTAAPGVRLCDDRYVALPARRRRDVQRGLEHACSRWQTPRAQHEPQTVCDCCMAELHLADSPENWLLWPIEQAGVAFGVLSVAYDSRDRRVGSYVERLDLLKPALDGIIRLFHSSAALSVKDVAVGYGSLAGEPQRWRCTETESTRALQLCESPRSASAFPYATALDSTPVESPVSRDLQGSNRIVFPELSKREREIAELLVAGYAAINVAAVLGLSEHTVRTYVRRLYRKLGVSNRAQLVRSCIRSDVRPAAVPPE